MMIEEKIQSILNDLYSLEPDLRTREPEIRQIINQLVALRPEIGVDPAFKEKLRQELASRGGRAGEGLKFKSNFLKTLISNITSMEKINSKVLAGASLVVLLLVAGSFYAGKNQNPLNSLGGSGANSNSQNPLALAPIGSKEQVKGVSLIKKFESEEEFKNYLAMANASGGFGRGGGGVALESNMALPSAPAMGMADSAQKSVSTPASAGNPSIDRSSQTNVQVAGIDEPDLVKTDGTNLYVSTEQNYYIMGDTPTTDAMPPQAVSGLPMEKIGIMPPYYQPQQNTQIISALPPEAMKKIAKIDKQGEMLLYKDVLIIFNYDYIYGYNIKDKNNPKEVWKIKYENNSQLNAARLMDGKLYLVTSSYPNFENPCPIMPMSINGNNIQMPCREIYHPLVPVSDATTYSAVRVNPENGQVENKLSFVGSSGQAVVYMSPDSLYLTYTYFEDQVKIMSDFLATAGKGIFPEAVTSKIIKLNSYDLYSSTKMTELQQILDRYMNGLDGDDRVLLQNNLQNKVSEYLKAHKRDLQFTGIVKVGLAKFEVEGTGTVPGAPLNQFALDEYQGNLRIATTIGESGFWYWGGMSRDESGNDVYVLDGNLQVLGKVQDLGKGERIYSARFIENRGYLVTFKQTDPFYVLDLANPKNPQVKGELKIPGFSSYLHPLATNRILGVGQENGRIKLSLFDVSDPGSPKEINKYSLDEYWTEVSNNHHAFLQDEKHGVFFLPGSGNGYIFSYSGDKLELKKAVSQIQAKRALYINDSMYIVGSDKIVVVDEKTWERVGELGF